MNFKVNAKLQYPWERLLQNAGYHLHRDSYVKRLSGDFYPRFHVYMKNETEDFIELNVHLDQRRGVHEGVTAHAGEYDSPIVIEEAERLKSIFANNIIN
ncbi:hypothetical protein ISR92_02030 [Patescibacteria group bacterium]|nr:hypothetical protein [Patescibacteria group bacterium]